MFVYTAAVLTPQSAELLKWVMRATVNLEERNSPRGNFELKTPQGEIIPHHMTINLGELKEELNSSRILRANAKLTVDYIAYDLEIGACAAHVSEAYAMLPEQTPINSINDERSAKHITICLAPGVKAFKSNELFEKIKAGEKIAIHDLYGETIRLDAVVQHCQ